MIEKLKSCIAAMDSITVTGRRNCFIVAAVCNDLEDVIKELTENDHPSKETDREAVMK